MTGCYGMSPMQACRKQQAPDRPGLGSLSRSLENQYFATNAVELNFQFALSIASAVSILMLCVEGAKVNGPAGGKPNVATDPALKVCRPYQVYRPSTPRVQLFDTAYSTPPPTVAPTRFLLSKATVAGKPPKAMKLEPVLTLVK